MEGVGEEKTLGEREEAGEEEGEEAELDKLQERKKKAKESRKENEKVKEKAELTFLLYDTGSPGITEETESPLGARADREAQGGVHQTTPGQE